EAMVQARAAGHAGAPFDLARDPLLRLCLLQLGPTASVLLFNIHHIIADAWSLGILGRELGALYAAACGGEAAALEPLAIQYADYALWQRGWLAGEVLERQLGYWRGGVGGGAALPGLAGGCPRPGVEGC